MTDHIFLESLQKGSCRAAYKSDHEWLVDSGVKQKILDVIKNSPMSDMPDGFCDKEILRPRSFSAHDHIRVVPKGSSIRPGTYIGSNVVIMPPSFVNIGAYIGDNTMIDSHVLIGSCAQIGSHVHISTGVQIGGVLEPIGSRPVIIEDNSFIGAGVILTEGILVKSKAVLVPGVVLSASVPIYDTVHKKIIRGEIPENAVVIPGTRPMLNNSWAQNQGLSMSCAIIVKYRDDKTDAALMLENALR